MQTFSRELIELIRAHVPPGSEIHTLRHNRPNWIVEVSDTHVLVETERSRAAGAGPQSVPAWMFEAAWAHLKTHRRLENKFLRAADGLNAKRSSAVCAILARLPGVEVESYGPIVLTLAG